MATLLSSVKSQTASNPTLLSAPVFHATPQVGYSLLQARETAPSQVQVRPNTGVDLESPAINSFTNALMQRAAQQAEENSTAEALIASEKILDRVHAVKYEGLALQGQDFLQAFPELSNRIDGIYKEDLSKYTPSVRAKIISHITPQVYNTKDNLVEQKLRATEQFHADAQEAQTRTLMASVREVMYEPDKLSQLADQNTQTFKDLYPSNPAQATKVSAQVTEKIFSGAADAILADNRVIFEDPNISDKQRMDLSRNALDGLTRIRDTASAHGVDAEVIAKIQTQRATIMSLGNTFIASQKERAKAQQAENEKNFMRVGLSQIAKDVTPAGIARSKTSLISLMQSDSAHADKYADLLAHADRIERSLDTDTIEGIKTLNTILAGNTSDPNAVMNIQGISTNTKLAAATKIESLNNTEFKEARATIKGLITNELNPDPSVSPREKQVNEDRVDTLMLRVNDLLLEKKTKGESIPESISDITSTVLQSVPVNSRQQPLRGMRITSSINPDYTPATIEMSSDLKGVEVQLRHLSELADTYGLAANSMYPTHSKLPASTLSKLQEDARLLTRQYRILKAQEMTSATKAPAFNPSKGKQ